MKNRFQFTHSRCACSLLRIILAFAISLALPGCGAGSILVSASDSALISPQPSPSPSASASAISTSSAWACTLTIKPDVAIDPSETSAKKRAIQSQKFVEALNNALSDPRINSKNGGTICIESSSKHYVISALDSSGNLPSVCNPKIGLIINKDNVWIRGVQPNVDPIVDESQRPIIEMIDMTSADINTRKDNSKSGRDIFTVFSFFNTTGGGISDLSFRGTHDQSVIIDYDSAHGRAIGFMGNRLGTVQRVDGDRLLGNLVKVTPFGDFSYLSEPGHGDLDRCDDGHPDWRNPYGTNPKWIKQDGTFEITRDATGKAIGGRYFVPQDNYLDHVQASRCMESGINFVGGTFRSHLSGAALWGNASAGVEAGGNGDVLRFVKAYANRYSGITLDGTNGTIEYSEMNENGGHTFGSYNSTGCQSSVAPLMSGYGLRLAGDTNTVSNSVMNGNMLEGAQVLGCGLAPDAMGNDRSCKIQSSTLRSNYASSGWGQYSAEIVKMTYKGKLNTTIDLAPDRISQNPEELTTGTARVDNYDSTTGQLILSIDAGVALPKNFLNQAFEVINQNSITNCPGLPAQNSWKQVAAGIGQALSERQLTILLTSCSPDCPKKDDLVNFKYGSSRLKYKPIIEIP